MDEVKCYLYFARVGTDCGVCMRVCPFSHPKTFTHSLAGFAARQGRFPRKTLVWLDDFFYGSRPKPQNNVSWVNYEMT